MSTLTLLEKLTSPDSLGSRDNSSTVDELRESIQLNLHRLLNSGQGHSFSAPMYGMPDLTAQLRDRPTTSIIIEEIRRAIEYFEPRLTKIKVTQATSEDQFKLSFTIQASILTEDGEIPSVFHTSLAGNGKLKLSSP